MARLGGTLNRIDFARVLAIPTAKAMALPVDLQFSVDFFAFPSVSHVLREVTWLLPCVSSSQIRSESV